MGIKIFSDQNDLQSKYIPCNTRYNLENKKKVGDGCLTINRVNRKADAAGLSYGKYVAREYLEQRED